MAALLQNNEVNIESIGVHVTIPNNNIARLMYYLSCVCTVINCENDADIQRFISYQNWHRLSNTEKQALVALCYVISPDVLENKVFFQSDALCLNSTNEFYKISQVQNQLLAAESIVIAGRTRQVNKTMVYKKQWMQYYYFDPMPRLASIFTNSVSSAVTHNQPVSDVQPINYRRPAQATDNQSHTYRNVCLCLCCLFCVVPTIVGIIVAIIISVEN